MKQQARIYFTALVCALLAPSLAAKPSDLLAIRVGRAETISKGVIEHAVILVENGKIVTIGEDLAVERGIPILDKPTWVVMPGLVNCYSRIGCDSEGGDDTSPEILAADELYPASEEFDEIIKHGVTTLGLYPAGNGIPGQAVAVKPQGETAEEMTLLQRAYLKIVMRADSASKKRVADGFKKADDHAEKVKKAREKWDKDQEKKKGGAKKDEKKEEPKKDEKKDEKKEDKPEEKKGSMAQEPKEEGKPETKAEEKKGDKFVPPAADPKVQPFVDLRSKELRAMVSITSAADYLHWLDVLGKEDINYDLRVVLNRDSDIFYVASKKEYDLDVDGIGDKKLRVVLEPAITLTPSTMRQRNLPNELSRAGAKIAFIPRNDDIESHRQWLDHVGELVAAGFDRELALRAVTLEPAEALGVAERVGSLEKGKDANIVFLNGDPFEPTTRIEAVMLEGRIVFGEVNQ
jgi:imidazolonepropionase-like amidohydrolase